MIMRKKNVPLDCKDYVKYLGVLIDYNPSRNLVFKYKSSSLFSYTAVSRKVVQLKSIKAYATIPKGMSCGCSLLHDVKFTSFQPELEGGAINTCLRVDSELLTCLFKIY